MKQDFIYKTTLLSRTGWSAKKVEDLLGDPDKVVKNPHNRKRSSYLYDLTRIKELEGSDYFISWKPYYSEDALKAISEKRKASYERQKKKRLRKKDLLKCYREHPETQLAQAFSAMFNLNRYIKQVRNKERKNDLYEIKDKFIHKVAPLATNFEKHKQEFPALKCNRCDGMGYDEDVDYCDACNGTGIYRSATVTYFLCCNFDIEGKHYSFHTPLDHADFKYTLRKGEKRIDIMEIKETNITEDNLWESLLIINEFIESYHLEVENTAKVEEVKFDRG